MTNPNLIFVQFSHGNNGLMMQKFDTKHAFDNSVSYINYDLVKEQADRQSKRIAELEAFIESRGMMYHENNNDTTNP